ncbi:hypothetical protein [Photobacterium halotolerans]|uniref:hypothetical protein n=1 Tax=Photobacterium halotolerans TaxID=265726 RepID=UPI001372C80E|nr:hypothetical protein [Photobacterium halotolerans]NAW86325.1 hypothetical protein [Photobacterium halotolerans]
MIVYAYSSADGRFIQTTNAQPDLLHSGEFLIPGYHSPQPMPDFTLSEGEYFAYLTENGKAPRRHQDGRWTVQKEKLSTTAWLKSDVTQSTRFEDVSEVTDDYTTEKPASCWDIWTESGWQTDEQAKFESEVRAINELRRQQYGQIVDPLMNEARMQRMLGDDASADKNEQQAQAWYLKIKQDNPWPPAPAAE